MADARAGHGSLAASWQGARNGQLADKRMGAGPLIANSSSLPFGRCWARALRPTALINTRTQPLSHHERADHDERHHSSFFTWQLNLVPRKWPISKWCARAPVWELSADAANW